VKSLHPFEQRVLAAPKAVETRFAMKIFAMKTLLIFWPAALPDGIACAMARDVVKRSFFSNGSNSVKQYSQACPGQACHGFTDSPGCAIALR
jgi:hypothetical protein